MELLNPLTIYQAQGIFPGKTLEATCLSTDSVLSWVYVRADLDPSGLPRVGKANPKLSTKMPAIGFITEKLTSTNCLVHCVGVTDLLTGLVPGREIFLGLDGTATQDPSSIVGDPGELAWLQVLGSAMGGSLALVLPNFNRIGRRG